MGTDARTAAATARRLGPAPRWALGLSALACVAMAACAAPQQKTLVDAADAGDAQGGDDADVFAAAKDLPVRIDDAAPPQADADADADAPPPLADAEPADGADQDTAARDKPPAAVTYQPCRAEVAAGPWWRSAVAYEIFVRSFADSNGDGIGDLKGILQKFDYLNDGKPGGDDLGVELIWLMPIQPSPSYHGYDVTDYLGVNPAYGTVADFEALTQLAHSRGVKIVIDLVLNHSSVKHPWFLDAKDGGSKDGWYSWRTTPAEATWKQPWAGGGKVWHASGKRWYYGVFSPNMPDLNVQKPEVTQALFAAADTWLQRGADGFRLDAVRYLIESGPGAGQQDTPATLAWWKGFSDHVAAKSGEALLVAEAWASGVTTAKYHTQGGLAMTFDFDLQSSLVTALQGGIGDGVRTVTCQHDALLGAVAATAGRGTFLSNHDQVRWTQAVQDPALRKVAAALLLFLPGTPFLYYGEEIGAANGPSSNDIDKRLPMAWDASPAGGFSSGTPWQPLAEHANANVAAQLADAQSQLRWVQKLVALRKQSAVLQRGSLGWLDTPDGWLMAVRQLGGQTWVGIFRLDDQGSPQVPSLDALGPLSQASDVLSGQALAVVAGRPQLAPMPQPGVRWIAVQ